MKVSVVVPTYNVEKVVTRTIDSLLNQKMNKEDYEIILVDDCSKDGTLSILNEYEQKYGNIRVYQLPENSGGASKPRNFGIDKARGEYIYLLDSDDYVIKDILIDGYTAAKKYNSDMVHFRIGSDGKREVVTRYFRGEKKNLYDVDIVKDEVYRVMGGQSRMYRRSFLKKYDLRFDESIHVGEDQIFNIEALITCNKTILLQEKDYVIMTSGDHDHLTNRELPAKEYFRRYVKIMDVFNKKYKGVNPQFIEQLRVAYLKKIQANKKHYKIITNSKYDYELRKSYFDESHDFLNKYISKNDYSGFSERWSGVTQAMRELDYDSFFDLYNRIDNLSRKDGIIKDGILSAHLFKQSQKISYDLYVPISWKNHFECRFYKIKIANGHLVIEGVGWNSLYQYAPEHFSLRIEAQKNDSDYYTIESISSEKNGKFLFDIDLKSLPFEKEKNSMNLYILGDIAGFSSSQRIKADFVTGHIDDKLFSLDNLYQGNLMVQVYQSKYGYVKLSYSKFMLK